MILPRKKTKVFKSCNKYVSHFWNKVYNLLSLIYEVNISVDWNGVHIVNSSFAQFVWSGESRTMNLFSYDCMIKNQNIAFKKKNAHKAMQNVRFSPNKAVASLFVGKMCYLFLLKASKPEFKKAAEMICLSSQYAKNSQLPYNRIVCFRAQEGEQRRFLAQETGSLPGCLHSSCGCLHSLFP